MVQGGAHGGSVAAPIATRILQRTLAMDEGNFDPQLAWLAPAQTNRIAFADDRSGEFQRLRTRMWTMATKKIYRLR